MLRTIQWILQLYSNLIYYLHLDPKPFAAKISKISKYLPLSISVKKF